MEQKGPGQAPAAAPETAIEEPRSDGENPCSGGPSGGENTLEKNPQTLGAQGKTGFFKLVGEIFAPLIPGAIVSGLCAGFASLLVQFCPEYAKSPVLTVIYGFLTLINKGFLPYMTAWVGYRAAERFGATPILGGMLGMMTSLGEIDAIAGALGLYNAADPLNSVLCAGRGGVIAVILGAWLLSRVEGFFHRRMPSSLNMIFTPILTMAVCTTLYVTAVMPLAGLASAGLCKGIEFFCMNERLAVRVAAGAVSAGLFLPLVAMGMNYGLTAIYAVQLAASGRITLYPALAMAGAGQVGASLALYTIARHNGPLRAVIKSAIPAGVMGVGQPLIYGVTLPLGRPFFTAGAGAVCGGAFVTACQVASTTWGPSGVLAVFIMTAGPNGPLQGMFCYCCGLFISCAVSFLLTKLFIREENIPEGLGSRG